MSLSPLSLRYLTVGVANTAAANEINSQLGFQVFGSSFYVDATRGSDLHNDGLSKGTAFATIGAAVSAATNGAGDLIVVAPGAYDETVLVNKSNLIIVGDGGRGSAYIEPQTATASGMQVTADDVTLINIGIAGESTATYALNLNDCSRFRAYACKIELASGAGECILADGTATGQVADALFVDCEIAWAARGFVFDDSVYGFVTQFFVQNCRFHNITTNMFGVNTNGLVNNLEVTGCTFDRTEAGVEPTDYILLTSNSNTGFFASNFFATATNSAAVLTIGTGLHWMSNSTEAGFSVARPA